MCQGLCFTVNGSKICVCIPVFAPRWPPGPIEGPDWIVGESFGPGMATELRAIATIAAATDFLAGEQQHTIRAALRHVTEAMERRLPNVTFESHPGNPFRSGPGPDP